MCVGGGIERRRGPNEGGVLVGVGKYLVINLGGGAGRG